MKFLSIFLFTICFVSCNKKNKPNSIRDNKQYLTVLGIAQDAGYPHIGCQKKCCADFYSGKRKPKSVTSLGLIDKENNQKWLFEATPNIATQLAILEQNHLKKETIIDGVFLTHAHIGHYAGLMYFGREALGKKNIVVYAMPKMKSFIENNGPWNQLVSLRNILIKDLKNDSIVTLNKDLKVTPFLVPHRDEFSETVGYTIKGPNKTALFIPDINKWSTWNKNIVEEVKKVDIAFLDATFFKEGEINRAMTEVPHPFIQETVGLFAKESKEVKNKIIFIHFNHTNPALQEKHPLKKEIEKQGFRFAKEGFNFEL